MGDRRRILVVDDDRSIAAAVRRALVYEGFDVDVAADGQTALVSARERRPDLVVLDVMLPGVDGIEVCRRLRAADRGLPILMLTARDATSDRVRGLDEGADDYLVKPFAYEELLARVRALLRRLPGEPRSVLRWDNLTMDLDAHEVTRGDTPLDLTAQEFRLLEQFLRHPRQVLTRDVLLELAWGYVPDQTNVVDVYVGYLRHKLGEPRILQTVRGVGYVLRNG